MSHFLAGVVAYSLILRIYVVVNWQLSKNSICWPVSHGQIGGSGSIHRGYAFFWSSTLQVTSSQLIAGSTPSGYLSNRPHFLWVYRRDNPRGMLGEHEKSGVDGFLLISPSQKLKKKPVGSIVHVFDSVCIKGRHSFQRGMFKKYLHSCVKNDSANKFNNTTS